MSTRLRLPGPLRAGISNLFVVNRLPSTIQIIPILVKTVAQRIQTLTLVTAMHVDSVVPDRQPKGHAVTCADTFYRSEQGERVRTQFTNYSVVKA